MSALTDDQRYIVARLRHGSPRERAITLLGLVRLPEPSTDVMAAVTALLDDATVTVLQIPIRLGEIRYAAAVALAAIRYCRGDFEPVVLDPGYPALTPTEMASRDEKLRSQMLSPEEAYAWLRDHGCLGHERLELDPRLYAPDPLLRTSSAVEPR